MNIRLTLVILSFLISVSVFAQVRTVKSFVYDGNTISDLSLTLNPNGTFKYLYNYDQIFDMACGTYKIIRDTVILNYEFDENDTCCNIENRKVIWDKASLLQNRPYRLFLKGVKLYDIENGTVKFRRKFPLRTNRNKILIQDNYYLIEKRYAKKPTLF